MLPTLADLKARRRTKGALAESLYPDQTFDFALPQQWVDQQQPKFAAWMYENIYGVPAGVDIVAAFVWLYPKGSIFGQPAPLYAEAAQWLESSR